MSEGATLEGVRNLGDEASVEDILEYLTGTFQGAAPFDTLLKNFFQLQQEDSEKVAQYSIKLESKLASLKWQYPHALSSETELQYKRDFMAYIKISGIVLGVLTKIPRLPMQNFSELQGKLRKN